MGADIHMWAEKRLRPTDPWQSHSKAEITAANRWYLLFGIIAGVRGGPSLYPIRGIPSNTSDEAKCFMNHDDFHSKTWLSLQELKKCVIKAYGKADEQDYDVKFNKNACKNPYFNRQKIPYSEYPTYDDIVGYFEKWIANEKAEAELLGITDVKPEVRFIIGFDS